MVDQKRMLIFGFAVLLLVSPVRPTQADFKGSVYELRFYFNRFPLYIEFAGTTEMSVVITPQIDTDYGSFENVKTIDYAPFIMYGKGLEGTLSFEVLRSYMDGEGREIGSLNIMEFNITRMGSFRIEMNSYRGNYTGSYPSWSDVFAATPGTIWSYTYEETVHGNVTSSDNSQLTDTNNTYRQRSPTTPSSNHIVLKLEAFENKTVAAGSFQCASLKQSSYVEGNFTGHRYLYRTQIGTEFPLVLQEDYNEDDKKVFTQELISLDSSQIQTTYTTSSSQPNSLSSIITKTIILLLFRLKTIILLLLGGLFVVILVRRIRTSH